MRLKDRNRAPCVPRGWRDPATQVLIGWPCAVPWNSFYSVVVRFYANNGGTTPSEEQVEEAICKQVSKEWCTGDSSYKSTTAPEATARASSGCKSCGSRR